MEHLEKIEMAAKDLIKYHLPNQGWTFVWDRSTRRKGQCRHGVKQIGLSRPIARLNTFECMMLTITHEIAHALCGAGFGHKKIWKDKCIEIGGDGKTYYDSTDTRIPERRQRRRIVYRYSFDPEIYGKLKNWNL